MVKFNAFKNVKESYTTVPKKMWKLHRVHKITLSLIGIYSLLTDRLSSSVKKGIIDKNLAFYDPKSAQWFADYSETEAAKNLGVTKGTASNIYHKLQKLGYIDYQVYPKNRVTKVYFPSIAQYLPQPKGIADKSSNTVIAFKGWVKRTYKNIGLPIKSLKLTVDLIQNKLNLDTKAAENIVRDIMAGRNQAAYDWHYSTTNKYFMFEKSGYFNSDLFISNLNGIFTVVNQNYQNHHILDINKINKYITESIKNHFEDWLNDNGIKPRQRKLKSIKKPINKYGDTSDTPKDLRGDPSKPSGKLHPASAEQQQQIKQSMAQMNKASAAFRARQNGETSSTSKSTNANKSNDNKHTNTTSEKPSDNENKGNHQKSNIETKISDLKCKINNLDPISNKSKEITHELNKAIAKKFIKDHHITKDDGDYMSITLLPNLKVLIKNVRDQAKNGNKNYCYSQKQIEQMKKDNQREKQPVTTDGSDVSDDDLPF